MEKKKTHWKSTMNPDYLGSWSFEEGEERNLKIKKASLGKVKSVGGREDTCIIAYMETGLPMIMNATNSKMITLFTGQPYIEDWNDVMITVYVDHGVKYQGSIIDGLRIKDEQPKGSAPIVVKEKPILKKDSDEYKKVVTFLNSQKGSEFDTVFSGPDGKYKISSTLKAQLKTEFES